MFVKMVRQFEYSSNSLYVKLWIKAELIQADGLICFNSVNLTGYLRLSKYLNT